jgi:type IV secretory pathway VirB4 component
MIDLGIPLIAREGLPLVEAQDRFRHLYVLGATGTGKTTFLLNVIAQELKNGMIVLDPAGSLAEGAAALAPADRLIYVDKDNPIVINPLDRPGLNQTQLGNELAEVVNACVSATTSSQETTVLHKELIRNAVKVLGPAERNIKYLADFLNYEEARKKHFKTAAPLPYWSHFDDRERQNTGSRLGI